MMEGGRWGQHDGGQALACDRAGLFVLSFLCFVCLYGDLRPMRTFGYGSSESCIDTQLKGRSSDSSMVFCRPVVELGVKGS